MKKPRNLLGLLTLVSLVATPQLARAEGDLKAVLAKIDSLQAQRDTQEKELDGLVSQAMKLGPNDYDALWRAARFHCWVAEGLPKSAKARREVESRQCWDLGAKAAALKPDAIEGNYYAANGSGAWSEEIGVLKALSKGMEGIFNSYLDKAIAIDPKYMGAAPLIAKGRYYFSLPWPKRSYSKSADMYRKALALEPNNPRAKLWLAETLVNDGKAKEAKTFLDQLEAQLAAGANGFDPPEVRRVQSWLEPVKQKVQEELK